MTNHLYIGDNEIVSTDAEEVIPQHRVSAVNAENLPECEEIVLPEGVTSLGPYLFSGSDMTSFVVPETVTSIEAGCFCSCENLESITLPPGLKSLGPRCFYGCSSLTTIELPDSLEEIGPECFGDCAGLQSIKIPDGVKSLPERCFYMCGSLESIKFPASLEYIGNHCFEDAGAPLGTITLPKALKKLGYHAFWYCSSTTSGDFVFPASIEYIGKDAFDNSFAYSCGDIWFEGGIPAFGHSALICFGDWSEANNATTLRIHYPANHPDWTEEAIQKLIEPEDGREDTVYSYYGIPRSGTYENGYGSYSTYVTEFIPY